MTRSRSLVALAGLAALMALLSVTTLVDTQTWYARALWFTVVIGVVGHQVRRFTSRGSLVVAAQALAVAVAAMWTYAGAATWYGLPTGAVVTRVGALVREFGATVYASSAPLPATPGVEFTLAMLGALVAIVVDYLAVSRAAPAAAGLPLLTVFLTATANSGTALPIFFFVVAASAWLLLLARHAQWGMTRWATIAARPLAPVASGARPEESASTRFGTVARRLGLAGLVLAVAVPAVVPHLPTRYVLDGLARSADARGNARVGFSSTLDVGRSLASGSNDPVLRYRTTAPTGAYLRVIATSVYDGTQWQPGTPVLGRSARLELAASVARQERVITVEDFRLDPPALATPQPITAADFNGVSWQVDELTSDVHVSTRPSGYSTTYLEPALTPGLLRDGVDGTAGPDALPSTRALQTALAVDPVSAPAVRAALEEATAGVADNPFDKAAAIQEWLRSTGGFSYTLNLSPTGSLDPLTSFLRTKSGYCVQFSTAMVMMARAARIPARMAIGFLPGRAEGGVFTVTSADAHSWPELYFPGVGWVRFEPTPSGRTGAAPAWTQVPITPLPNPTSTARPSGDPLERPERPDREIDAAAGTVTEVSEPVLDRVRRWLADPLHLVLLALALGLAGGLVLPATAYLLRRMRTRAGGRPVDVVEAQWQELTGRLHDLGIDPPPGGTLRDWQAHYARAGYLDDSGRERLGHVVATVEAARYARPGTDVDTDLAEPTRALVQSVARTRSWRHRLRAIVAPGDARAWWGAMWARPAGVVERTLLARRGRSPRRPGMPRRRR